MMWFVSQTKNIMNPTNTAVAGNRIAFKLEDAPSFGQGSMPTDQERTFAMLAHFFPLIIWFWKRKHSPVVDAHGKEAMNFSITMFICVFAISIVSAFLGATVAAIASLLLVAVNLGGIALVICAMLQARNGKLLRYPVNFRLIK